MATNTPNSNVDFPLEIIEGTAPLSMCKNLRDMILNVPGNVREASENRYKRMITIGTYRIGLKITPIRKLSRGSAQFEEQATELIAPLTIEQTSLDDDGVDEIQDVIYEIVITKGQGAGFSSVQRVEFNEERIISANNQEIVEEGYSVETGRAGINREDVLSIISQITSPGSNVEMNPKLIEAINAILGEMQDMVETNDVMHKFMDTIERLRAEKRRLVARVQELKPIQVNMEEFEESVRKATQLECQDALQTKNYIIAIVVLLAMLTHLVPAVINFDVLFGDKVDDNETPTAQSGDDDETEDDDDLEGNIGYNAVLREVAKKSISGKFNKVSGNIPNMADARIFEVRKYDKVIVPEAEIDSKSRGCYVGFEPSFQENFPLEEGGLPRSFLDFDPAGKDMVVVVDNKGNKALYRFNGNPPTQRYETHLGDDYTHWVFVVFNGQRVMHYHVLQGEVGAGFKSDLETMVENADGTDITIVTREQYNNRQMDQGMPAQTFLNNLKPVTE